MVALLNDGQFKDVDSERFTAALTMAKEEEDSQETDELFLDEPFLAVSASNESTTLQLSHLNKSSRLSTRGVLKLMDHCESIRELSLAYSLLSDELLKALGSDAAVPHLETLRLEAQPESKPAPSLSPEAWHAFASHLPSVNLVLLAYLTEPKEYESLLATYVPLTHIYFGEGSPNLALERVGERCPRLTELVVGDYGPGTADEALQAAARGCPRLRALGLGDCEVTCSGFIEFVSLCCERLQVLYVLETSLIEDSEYDVTEVSVKVSSLLRKSWQPHYVPYW